MVPGAEAIARLGVKQEKIRAFIAIVLPQEIKDALAHRQTKLKEGGDLPIKWVSAEGIHLTLKFLGNVDSTMLPQITQAMAYAAQGIGPFRLELGQLGVFPDIKRPRVVWVGVEGELTPLKALQKNIERALEPLGLPREDRPFTPHLTLGRIKDKISSQQGQKLEILLKAGEGKKGAIFVEAIHLIRSTLTPRGALYTTVASTKLK